MIVVTWHGEEEAKPIALVSTYENVRKAIVKDVKGWLCPPSDIDVRFDKSGVYTIYEDGRLYDEWNRYTATPLKLDDI